MDKYNQSNLEVMTNQSTRRRKSIRLKGYDYSQAGMYFITLCCHNKVCLFGEIVDEKIILNDVGKTVDNEWKKSEIMRDEIKLHQYVVMPNHFHAIVEIMELNIRANGRSPLQSAPTHSMQSRSIGSLIAGFKSSVTKNINRMRCIPGNTQRNKIWQRNYWEHVIRNEMEYHRLAQYIIDNPNKWAFDKLNIENTHLVREPQTT